MFSSGFGLIGTKSLHFTSLSGASKKVNIFLTMRTYSIKKLAKDRKLKCYYTVLLFSKWFKKSMFCSLFSQIIPSRSQQYQHFKERSFLIKQFIDTRKKAGIILTQFTLIQTNEIHLVIYFCGPFHLSEK